MRLDAHTSYCRPAACFQAACERWWNRSCKSRAPGSLAHICDNRLIASGSAATGVLVGCASHATVRGFVSALTSTLFTAIAPPSVAKRRGRSGRRRLGATMQAARKVKSLLVGVLLAAL